MNSGKSYSIFSPCLSLFNRALVYFSEFYFQVFFGVLSTAECYNRTSSCSLNLSVGLENGYRALSFGEVKTVKTVLLATLHHASVRQCRYHCVYCTTCVYSSRLNLCLPLLTLTSTPSSPPSITTLYSAIVRFLTT